MTTIVTLHSGARTIGGVCVSVEYGAARAVLDFGSPYVPEAQVFDGRVQPRRRTWVADSIRLGLFPRVDGVYAAEDLAADAAGDGWGGKGWGAGDGGADRPAAGAAGGIGGLVPAERSQLETAVFVSTLYLDHMAAIGAVADRVPVYMGPVARRLELAMETCGLGVRSRRSAYQSFEFDQPVRVGEIEVLPITSYTDGFGSCSFLVTTPDGTAHWTGNLTIDGFESGHTLAEIDLLRRRGLDVLFCDATRFSFDEELSRAAGPDGAVAAGIAAPAGAPTNADLDAELARTIATRPGLAVVNVYQRELASVAKLAASAAAAGRLAVFEPDLAFVARECLGLTPAVYTPDSAGSAGSAGEGAPPAWLARLRAECPAVTRAEIAAEPRRFLLQNSYANILELLSLPSAGGVYIHLDGEPVGRFDPSWANMERVLGVAGFELACFDYNDVVGHAFPGAVQHYVEAVAPRVLVPCHSTRPQLLAAAGAKQLLPEPGRPFDLAGRPASRDGRPR
ncbi:MAG: hypothetical protein LBD70_04475 [Bifidobacteriaceae bacterium]|jgi:ribonuclease J|nr:hypothetical protein [Bifidobacteriaceae bacterium]